MAELAQVTFNFFSHSSYMDCARSDESVVFAFFELQQLTQFVSYLLQQNRPLVTLIARVSMLMLTLHVAAGVASFQRKVHAMGRDGGLNAQMIPTVRAIQECADAVKRLASFFLFLQTNFWIPNEFLESNDCVPTVNTTTTQQASSFSLTNPSPTCS